MAVTPEVQEQRLAAVRFALRLLGQSWRSDWSDFDGRTLRSQLEGISDLLRSEQPLEDLRTWIDGCGMCPKCANWQSWCDHDQEQMIAEVTLDA
jgi:hypothetical protein